MHNVLMFLIVVLSCNTYASTLQDTREVSATSLLRVSWPRLNTYNPFSTQKLHYEIWHNGKYLKTVDDNLIEIRLHENPALISGCLQIRAVSGQQKSDFSKQSCYSFS